MGLDAGSALLVGGGLWLLATALAAIWTRRAGREYEEAYHVAHPGEIPTRDEMYLFYLGHGPLAALHRSVILMPAQLRMMFRSQDDQPLEALRRRAQMRLLGMLGVIFLGGVLSFAVMLFLNRT